jgi:hypothetical protein
MSIYLVQNLYLEGCNVRRKGKIYTYLGQQPSHKLYDETGEEETPKWICGKDSNIRPFKVLI